MQFGFMPGKGTVNALSVFEKEWKKSTESLHMCFVDLGNAYNRAPK